MSVRTLPLLFLNLGGEMLYILNQRLQAQNIPTDKTRKVLNDIISTMFNRKFIEELLKPQELYSKKALRTVYDRLAHASIMRLSQASMDKLYNLMTMAFKYQVLLCPRPKDVLLVTFNHLDAIKGFIQDSPAILHQVDETSRQLIELYNLMTMAFKYQVLLCPRPKDVLLVTFNHLDAIKGFIQDSPAILHQVDETSRQLIEIYGSLSAGDFQLIRQTLLIFFQDLHIRVKLPMRKRGRAVGSVEQYHGCAVTQTTLSAIWSPPLRPPFSLAQHVDQSILSGSDAGVRLLSLSGGILADLEEVSIFLKDKVQNSNGRFVLPVSGPVPWGTEVPGLIRTFNSKGEEVKTAEFKHGGNYVPAAQEGSFELYGDRVLKLGTNMYSVNPPAEAKTSTASDSAASRTPESIAPNPLAKEELNLLARLMGGMEIKTPSGPEPGFRLNLFTTDEEEEQAALASQEEPSCEVIDIQATQTGEPRQRVTMVGLSRQPCQHAFLIPCHLAFLFQDPQRGEELARIMGEFEITDEPRRSTSKGDDLLAMMDEL
ncbi:Protein OSCP1 [Tupaia chinensis]|uniref:Protein OSCP1 n=1 Tax=Tupaia chinensis TaxID=246437 RepID=L9JC66_TUPCH|nr:Protein OSCP1 [Tupaia chinensis]